MHWHQELTWNLFGHCVLIYTSAVILHGVFSTFFIPLFFHSSERKKRNSHTTSTKLFRVTLKLWLRLTNDLPVGISFSAQNWPLKNIVIRHGGDFIGISLFIPVGCQASFCMNHLSKNQWEVFEHHFSWKRTEIPKLHKCIDVCPCVCGWVKWNCVWTMKNDKEL